MKQLITFGTASTLAVLLATTAARADLTADEVWQGWVDYYSTSGQTVTEGARDRQGDTLVLTDVSFASPQTAEATVTATVPEIRLKELGDGRVEITMAKDVPILLKGKPAEGEAFETKINLSQQDMVITASGTPEDVTYETVAPMVGMAVDGLTVDGKPAPFTMNVTLKNSKGTSHMLRSGGFQMETSFSAEAADLALKAADPEGKEGSFDMTGSFTGLAGTSRAKMVEGVDMTNMAAALNAGTDISGEFSYGAGNYKAEFSGPEGPGSMTYDGTGGKVHFAMSKDQLAYGGESSGSTMSMTVPTLPVPLDLGIGSSLFDLAMPVSKSDTAQPLRLAMKLNDVTLSDGIWNMFDPGAKLPRDPATVVVDAEGTAVMKVDIFDPANAESKDMPFEVQDAKLNELHIKLAGADLTGTGAVTVNNSTMPPKPVGSVDLKLVGGNGLLDKLVEMKLIPEDQAMGVRMMLGVFAVTAGEDVLTSKIEFTEDGGISANGQRLQ